MKALVFAGRELRENRLVWAGAAFVAAAAWLLPWLRTLGRAPEGAAQAAPLAIHLGCVLTVAGFLAFRGLPGDLGERRLGFELAQPVGIGSILFGRLLGAWLLAAGSGALVLLPALLARRLPWGQGFGLAGISTVLAVPTLLACHLLGVAWRARSAWILLDLGMTAGCLWALGALMDAYRAEAPGGLGLFMGETCLLLVALLALSAWLPLEKGRTDLARVRRWQAAIFGPGLLLLPAWGLLLLLWSRGGGPASIHQRNWTLAAPEGSWAVVGGEGRLGRLVGFLVNETTGACTAPPPGPCQFSGDGRRLVWVQGDFSGLAVWSRDLSETAGAPQLRARLGSGARSWNRPAVSRDGRRVAVPVGHRLAILDLAAGQVVWVEQGLRDPVYSTYAFLPDGSFCETPRGRGEARIFDPATGAWR